VIESYTGVFDTGRYYGYGTLTRGSETFEGLFENGAFIMSK